VSWHADGPAAFCYFTFAHPARYLDMRLLLFATLLLQVSPVLAADIHGWIDAKGVQHFSDRPAHSQASRPLALRAAPSPGPSQARTETPAQRAAAEQRRFDQALRRDAVQEAEARRLRCQEWKTQLNLLEQRPRLRTTDAMGSPRALTGAERQALLDETRNRLRVSCAW
jgi:hypothetical protein